MFSRRRPQAQDVAAVDSSSSTNPGDVMLMIGLGGDPYKIHHEGYYEDTYVKTPKGWRFKSRIHHVAEGGTTGQGQGQDRGGQQGQAPNAAPAAPVQER